jgi:hypothetical protein
VSGLNAVFLAAHKAGCMRTITKYRGNAGGIGLHMHTAAATVTSLMLLDILNWLEACCLIIFTEYHYWRRSSPIQKCLFF